MPDVRLDTRDAAELAELRQFLAEWLVRDPGPKSIEGGGFAAAHFRARRACYGAAPPAPRALRVSSGNGLRPPLTPETAAAPGARKSGQAQACPRAARGAQTPQRRATGASRTPGHR